MEQSSEPGPTSPNSALLANSLRRLLALAVTVQAPTATLSSAAAAIDAVTRALEPFVPTPPPPRYPRRLPIADLADLFPYDYVLGPLNPLAPPVRVRWESSKAIGQVWLGTPYEGPPGCVHGGVIAAVFDQILTVANLMSGSAGPTAHLDFHYRRPTPLFCDLVFEGWQVRTENRKSYMEGRLLADGQVTVEASGLFIMLPIERAMGMLDAANASDTLGSRHGDPGSKTSE